MEHEHDSMTSKRYKEDFDGLVIAANKADALNARYADLLRQIAYPRRGTDEEKMDIFDAAKLIQSNFTADELGDG